MVQTDLLENLTDAAVNRAGNNADITWLNEARSAVKLLIRKGEDFTTDDVWELLEGVNAYTHEPRALGAIIRELSKDGAIYSTGGYRKSIRKECHRRPLAVWRPVVRHRSVGEV